MTSCILCTYALYIIIASSNVVLIILFGSFTHAAYNKINFVIMHHFVLLSIFVTVIHVLQIYEFCQRLKLFARTCRHWCALFRKMAARHLASCTRVQVTLLASPLSKKSHVRCLCAAKRHTKSQVSLHTWIKP